MSAEPGADHPIVGDNPDPMSADLQTRLALETAALVPDSGVVACCSEDAMYAASEVFVGVSGAGRLAGD